MNSMKRTPTPCSRPKRGEVDDLVVVDAPHHDAVDLHRVEPGVERGVDAGEHRSSSSRRVSARNTSRRSESSDTLIRRRPAAARSCASSGSFTPLVVMREVDAERREHLDEPRRRARGQGLAAGEADRLEAEPLDADPGDPGDLLVGEQLVAAASACPPAGMQ